MTRRITKQQCTSRNAGFTLIEIVITIVIVSILAALAGVIILQGVRAYTAEPPRGNVHYQTRLAVERIARETRTIQSCATFSIVSNPTGTLSFSDINGNPVVFSVLGGNLLRGASLLATGITSPTPFSFLASDLTATTACPGIWYIDITISDTQGASSLQMRTRVHPMNF